MGRVNDPELARSTPCHGYKYQNPATGEDVMILYSDGIKGILTKDQIDEFCQVGIEVEEATERQKKRLDTLAKVKCLSPQALDIIFEALDALGTDEALAVKEELEDVIQICE